mmetsp:Transcript_13099/g.21820  ORF Transcript_13099/g.21820 Transcript_13099/m.21820 type:complete len:221 (-) Transcript_13099:566-1228(-)
MSFTAENASDTLADKTVRDCNLCCCWCCWGLCEEDSLLTSPATGAVEEEDCGKSPVLLKLRDWVCKCLAVAVDVVVVIVVEGGGILLLLSSKIVNPADSAAGPAVTADASSCRLFSSTIEPFAGRPAVVVVVPCCCCCCCVEVEEEDASMLWRRRSTVGEQNIQSMSRIANRVLIVTSSSSPPSGRTPISASIASNSFCSCSSSCCCCCCCCRACGSAPC